MSTASSPSAAGTTHPGLLTEIMSHTLDEDYQVAAARPGPDPDNAVVVAFGAMVGISAIRTEQDKPIAAAERDQLVAQIHERQGVLDDLHNRLTSLEGAVAGLQSAASANEILVSEKVYGALSGEKPQADRTTLDPKGKAELLTAFILR